MSGTAQGGIPVTVSDPEEWERLASSPEARALGLPPGFSYGGMAGFLAAAVTALFASESGGDPGSLQGFFSAEAAQTVARYPCQFDGKEPAGVTLELVGPVHDPHAPGETHLRVHLHVALTTGGAPSGSTQMFFDIAANAKTVVTVANCPTCGAPAPAGTLVCAYCGADVRAMDEAGLLVARVQFY